MIEKIKKWIRWIRQPYGVVTIWKEGVTVEGMTFDNCKMVIDASNVKVIGNTFDKSPVFLPPEDELRKARECGACFDRRS